MLGIVGKFDHISQSQIRTDYYPDLYIHICHTLCVSLQTYVITMVQFSYFLLALSLIELSFFNLFICQAASVSYGSHIYMYMRANMQSNLYPISNEYKTKSII